MSYERLNRCPAACSVKLHKSLASRTSDFFLSAQQIVHTILIRPAPQNKNISRAKSKPPPAKPVVKRPNEFLLYLYLNFIT